MRNVSKIVGKLVAIIVMLAAFVFAVAGLLYSFSVLRNVWLGM